MSCAWFNESVKPLLKGFSLEYSSFADEDFRDFKKDGVRRF